MTVAAKSLARPPISADEMERRRLIVRKADHENLIEGIERHPETDHLFDAYIRGEIDVTELMPRLKAFQAKR